VREARMSLPQKCLLSVLENRLARGTRRLLLRIWERSEMGHLEATMCSFIAYCTSSALFLRFRISMTRYL
jgi:hypothetical protein